MPSSQQSQESSPGNWGNPGPRSQSATVESPPAPQPAERQHSPLTIAVRYVLPALGVLAGVVVMAMGDESNLEGGAGIVGASLAIYAMNWLYRASVNGDRERDAEEAARDYLDAHGYWPDEAPREPEAPASRSR